MPVSVNTAVPPGAMPPAGNVSVHVFTVVPSPTIGVPQFTVDTPLPAVAVLIVTPAGTSSSTRTVVPDAVPPVFVAVSVYVTAPPTVTVVGLALLVSVRFVGSGLHVFVVVALPTAGVVDAVLLKPTFVVLPGVVVSQPTPLDPLATVPGASVTVAVIVYTWLTPAPMLVVAAAIVVALPFVSANAPLQVAVSAPAPVALQVALLIVTPVPKCGVSVSAYVVDVPPLFVVVSLYWIVY